MIQALMYMEMISRKKCCGRWEYNECNCPQEEEE